MSKLLNATTPCVPMAVHISVPDYNCNSSSYFHAAVTFQRRPGVTATEPLPIAAPLLPSAAQTGSAGRPSRLSRPAVGCGPQGSRPRMRTAAGQGSVLPRREALRAQGREAEPAAPKLPCPVQRGALGAAVNRPELALAAVRLYLCAGAEGAACVTAGLAQAAVRRARTLRRLPSGKDVRPAGTRHRDRGGQGLEREHLRRGAARSSSSACTAGVKW